jgi:hypothetical protein
VKKADKIKRILRNRGDRHRGPDKGTNMLQELAHQKAALPLHKLIVVIVGLMGLACVVAGLIAILHTARAPSEISIFSARVKTGDVGVALVAIGLLVGLFTFLGVLKNQRDLAAIEGRTRSF